VVIQHEEMVRNNLMGNEEKIKISKMIFGCDQVGQLQHFL
jgi:hypothetical protein